jgi:hypothetical protein
VNPRVYVYKITFVEVPNFYHGWHLETSYNEVYWGSPVTYKDFWNLYTPVKTILKEFDYSDSGVWDAMLYEEDLIRCNWTNPLSLNRNCGGKIHPKSVKRLWEDPSFRSKVSNLMKIRSREQWKDPDYRNLHSNKMKLQWKDLNFIEASKRNPRGLGTMWITDGTKEGSLKIKRGDPIPEGFRAGRVCR